MIGIAVSAAGSILGGMAANALGAGKKSGEGIQGGGANTFQATATVGGQNYSVPQVDASSALAKYAQAAVEQEKFYWQGLKYFEGQIALAKDEIKTAFYKANQELSPMSSAAKSAIKEMQRFMGLDPESATAGFLQNPKYVGDLKHGGTPLDKKYINQIREMERIKDTAERAKAVAKLKSTYDTDTKITKSMIAARQLENDKGITRLQAEMDRLGNMKIGRKEYFMDGTEGWSNDTVYDDIANYEKLSAEQKEQYSNPWGGGTKFSESAIKEIKRLQTQMDKARAEQQFYAYKEMSRLELAGEAVDEYTFNYTPEYDDGYTGAEVTQKLQQTPGYQFQFDQGTKAIERQGAAKGMLGSGNTLTALTQYGQDLAQNYFQINMSNLANIASIGSGAVSQTAANLVGEGTNYAQLSVQQGEVGYNTNAAIGNARAESLYHQGDTEVDVAKFNASMQHATLSQARSIQAGEKASGMAAMPGMMGAQNQRQALSYMIGQNQQAGRAMYQPMTHGAASPNIAFPNYTGKTQMYL